MIITDFVHTRAAPKNHIISRVKGIIEYIADGGSVQASLRRLEVEQLAEQLDGAALTAWRTTGLEGLQQSDRHAPRLTPPTADAQEEPHRFDPMLGSPFFDQWNFDAGLSADQIMNLADALEGDFVFHQ